MSKTVGGYAAGVAAVARAATWNWPSWRLHYETQGRRGRVGGLHCAVPCSNYELLLYELRAERVIQWGSRMQFRLDDAIATSPLLSAR